MRHAPLSRASLGLLCVGAAAGARPSAFRGRPATHSCVPRAAVVLSAPRPSGEGCPGGGAGEDHTSADLDMEVLRRRIRRSGGTLDSVAPYADLAACADIAEGSHLDDLAFGWVLLFAPRTDEEGVYTVQDDDETTFVLAFESHDDATRFAQQLEAEDFDLPSVAQWSMDSLTDFCEEGDFKVGLVPDGVRAAARRARARPRAAAAVLLRPPRAR